MIEEARILEFARHGRLQIRMASPPGGSGDDASAAIRQQVYMSELQDNCIVRGIQGLVGGAIVGVIFGNLFVSVRALSFATTEPNSAPSWTYDDSVCHRVIGDGRP